jgi:hypothetical protein
MASKLGQAYEKRFGADSYAKAKETRDTIAG